jgi:putative hydrolase of the HAD superfamily
VATTGIRAVFWDFGGVILSSPFAAFNAYEARRGIPADTIRRINATDPDTNAWARLERNELDAAGFDSVFASEAASLGFDIPGTDVLALLAGEVRAEMVAALDRVIEAGFVTACLTNNVAGGAPRADTGPVMARFHHVIESSKVGVRKPEVAFYEIACRTAGVEPAEVVFLDDLGINLKPAAAMGMTTIKVVDPQVALASLAAVLDLELD